MMQMTEKELATHMVQRCKLLNISPDEKTLSITEHSSPLQNKKMLTGDIWAKGFDGVKVRITTTVEKK